MANAPTAAGGDRPRGLVDCRQRGARVNRSPIAREAGSSPTMSHQWMAASLRECIASWSTWRRAPVAAIAGRELLEGSEQGHALGADDGRIGFGAHETRTVEPAVV